MSLGLSDTQKSERLLRLHAGDAANVMSGNYRAVYRRVKGLDPDDDLSGEFRVQLGSYTEPFNLAWTMRQTGREIEYYSANGMMCSIWIELTDRADLYHSAELIISKRYPWMACNLDGMTTTPEGHRCTIDAKHVARWTEAEVLRYTPGSVWQAICAGTDYWALSPISGNKWELPHYEEVDPLYRADMIARARECWGYIEAGEEPPEAEVEPVLAPKPTPKLRSLIVPTDPEDLVFKAMIQKDNWLAEACDHMRAIIGTDAAAKVNAINRDEMKSLVPEEVGEVRYGRYSGKRDKAGVLRQNVAKLEEDDAPTP